MKTKKRLLTAVTALVFMLSIGLSGIAFARHEGDASMDMHHMHTLMNHGLEMVAEGSNMVMLAEMKMTPSVDPMTLEHGRHMIKSGKEGRSTTCPFWMKPHSSRCCARRAPPSISRLRD